MLVLEKKHKHFTIDDTTDGREDISQPNDCFFIVPSYIDHIQSGSNPISSYEKLFEINVHMCPKNIVSLHYQISI